MLPDEIRDSVGSAARNLGSEGVRKGITTTLPLALGSLQVSGHIRRIPVNGRLDQQRYRYALWQPNPPGGHDVTASDAFTDLARHYFRWIGPASLAEFQWFSGLGVKAAKAAVEPLRLVSADSDGDRLMLADDQSAFGKFNLPAKPQYALVSSLDAMFLLRRNISTLVAPTAQAKGLWRQRNVRPG